MEEQIKRTIQLKLTKDWRDRKIVKKTKHNKILRLGFITPENKYFPINDYNLQFHALINIADFLNDIIYLPNIDTHCYVSLNYDTAYVICCALAGIISSKIDCMNISEKDPYGYQRITDLDTLDTSSLEPTMKLYSVLPYQNYISSWKNCYVFNYAKIEHYSSNMFYVRDSPCQVENLPEYLDICNHYVIDHADFVIMVNTCDDITISAKKYCQEKNKPVSYLHPKTHKVKVCAALKKFIKNQSISNL